MSCSSDNSYPSDICLMLRAHGEQRRIDSQLLPALRLLEPPRSVAEEQLGAALAYLEVLWLDAVRRAAETEAALKELLECDPRAERPFHAQARRYELAVRALRDSVAARVHRVLAPPNGSHRHEPAKL
jgi:hypothetical protein